MNDSKEGSGMCDEQRRLLAAAVPALPIAPAKIRETLQRAAMDARRGRVLRRTLSIAGAVAFLGLTAAGIWRWNGENPDEGLTFRTAIDITRDGSDYSRTNVQTAAFKVSTDITRMLSDLIDSRALTRDLKATMLEALDSPVPITVPYESGVEELRWKLDNGGALTSEDAVLLKQAMYAAVAAIRSLGERRADMREVSDGICRIFRDYVTKVEAERGLAPPDDRVR